MARVLRMASVHAWACQTWIDVNIMNFLEGRETHLFTGKFNSRFDDRVNSNVKRKVGGVRSESLEGRTPGLRTGMKSMKCCLSQADRDLVCVCFSPNVNRVIVFTKNRVTPPNLKEKINLNPKLTRRHGAS
jgi:hypothetical protein